MSQRFPAGHVLEIGEGTFHRLLREAHELRDPRLNSPEEQDFYSGVFTRIGRHPEYGEIVLSRVDQPAAHPNRPSFSMIVMADKDDPKIPAMRAELEIDPLAPRRIS